MYDFTVLKVNSLYNVYTKIRYLVLEKGPKYNIFQKIKEIFYMCESSVWTATKIGL